MNPLKKILGATTRYGCVVVENGQRRLVMIMVIERDDVRLAERERERERDFLYVFSFFFNKLSC
jgi:hypothetical protein